MMACDLEFSLLSIIMYASPDPFNQKRLGEFSEMHLNEKINNAVCDLKKYNRKYYKEFKEDFDALDEFRIIRNDMAHCVGFFPNKPDLNMFCVDSVQKEDKKDKANKNEWFARKNYPNEYISESLDRFAAINMRLAALFYRLKLEFELTSKTHPFVKPSTGT